MTPAGGTLAGILPDFPAFDGVSLPDNKPIVYGKRPQPGDLGQPQFHLKFVHMLVFALVYPYLTLALFPTIRSQTMQTSVQTLSLTQLSFMLIPVAVVLLLMWRWRLNCKTPVYGSGTNARAVAVDWLFPGVFVYPPKAIG